MKRGASKKKSPWWHYDHWLRIGRIRITARVNAVLGRHPALFPGTLFLGGALVAACGLLIGHQAGPSQPAGAILLGVGAVGLVFGVGFGLASLLAYLAGVRAGHEEEVSETGEVGRSGDRW